MAKPLTSTFAAAMTRFKLVYFVPPESLQAVESAVFAAGAGKFPGPGSYTECAWKTLGTGQFRPGTTANPYSGKIGELEKDEEYRVEVLCNGLDVVKQAVEALKKYVRYRIVPLGLTSQVGLLRSINAGEQLIDEYSTPIRRACI